MRRNGIFKVVAFGVLLLWVEMFATSCDIFSGVNEPEFDNPRDPQSENADPPKAKIVGYDTTETVTIESSSVTLEWEPDTSGVTENVEYSYGFARIGETIDEDSFSDWDTVSTVTFNYLNESLDNGNYTFQVRARVQNQQELSSTTEFTFSVDAVSKGPIFYPRRLSRSDGTYSTELYLDGISASDAIVAGQFEIEYPSESVEVESVDIYKDKGFLNKAGGEEILGFTDTAEPGKLMVNIGLLGGDISKLSGSGAVAKVNFTKTQSESDSFNISFGSQTLLSDSTNSNIPIDQMDSALITN